MKRPLTVLLAGASLLLSASCSPMSREITEDSAGWNGGFERARSGLPTNWIVYAPETLPEGDYELRLDREEHTEGEQSLYYRLRLFRKSDRSIEMAAPPFPAVPELEEPYASALEAIVQDVRRQSADIETFTATLLKAIASASPDDNVRLFVGDGSDLFAVAEAARTLLAGARIPARILQVLPLVDEPRQVEIQPWLAVHNGDRWLFFDPGTGVKGLPSTLMIWRWGAGPLVRVSGGSRESVEFRVAPGIQDALSLAQQEAASRERPRPSHPSPGCLETHAHPSARSRVRAR